MIRPKKGDIIWAQVTERLCRKVKVIDVRKSKGTNEYYVDYLNGDLSRKWIQRNQLIKYGK
jgi:hypothetical protein